MTFGLIRLAHRQAVFAQHSVLPGKWGTRDQRARIPRNYNQGTTPMTTLTQTADAVGAARVPKDFRRLIIAASVGNVIEWYDFYIFGSLAAVLAVKFFEKTHPVAALLSTIALFTAGFLIRPLGAFLFGWMGDRI